MVVKRQSSPMIFRPLPNGLVGLSGEYGSALERSRHVAHASIHGGGAIGAIDYGAHLTDDADNPTQVNWI